MAPPSSIFIGVFLGALLGALAGAATTLDEKAELYDKWEKLLNARHFVLKRASYNLTRSGIGALFPNYG